jgi:hypothetical protein
MRIPNKFPGKEELITMAEKQRQAVSINQKLRLERYKTSFYYFFQLLRI